MASMDTSLTASEIIDALGGTCAVAELCDIKPPSVSEWKETNRIPKARLMYLRLLRPDVFEKIEQSKKSPQAET